MTINDDIYKIVSENELPTNGITKEELANIVLFKLLQQPYFNGSYNYIDLALYCNKKVVLNHPILNNFYIVTNNYLSSKNFSFKKTGEFLEIDNSDSKTARTCNENNKYYINILKELLLKNDTIEELVKEVEKECKKDNKFLLSINHQLGNTESYDNRKFNIINLITSFMNKNENYDFCKFSKEFHSEIYLHGLNDLKIRDIFYYELNEHLKLKKEDLQKKMLNPDEFKKNMLNNLLGNNNTIKVILNNLNENEDTPEKRKILIDKIKNIPSLYNQSIFKILMEVDDYKKRIEKIISNNIYPISRKLYLNYINDFENTNKEIQKKIDDNSDVINDIISSVISINPILKASVDSSSIKIKSYDFNQKKEIANYRFFEKLDNLEKTIRIYTEDNDTHMASKGFLCFKEKYRKDGVYLIGRNKNEVLSSVYLYNSVLEDNNYNKINNNFNLLSFGEVNISYHLRRNNECLDKMIDNIFEYCRKNKFHLNIKIRTVDKEFYKEIILKRIDEKLKDNSDIVVLKDWPYFQKNSVELFKNDIKNSIILELFEEVELMDFESFSKFNKILDNKIKDINDNKIIEINNSNYSEKKNLNNELISNIARSIKILISKKNKRILS